MKLSDLTPERKRVLLAEAEGWYDFGTTAPQRGSMEPRIIGRNKESMDRRIIPDYLTDLNACHALESKLTDEQHYRFRHYIRSIVNKLEADIWSDAARRRYVSASASQRADALLLTLYPNLSA